MRTLTAIALFALVSHPVAAQLRARLPSSGGVSLNPSLLPAGPPPTALAVTGTPSTATITWSPPAGATSFTVYRALPGRSWTSLTATPITATRFEDRSGFDLGSAYVYRVVALQGNGMQGHADVNFQPPPPVNPSWARATAQGTDVVVTWAPVAGVSRYSVAGRSSSDWRDVPAGVTSVTYDDVPAGSYQYRVASVYDPGPIMTAVSEWTPAAITTTAASGRYRVTIAGFRVNQPTYDDQLNRDGWSDEVHATAFVQQVNRTTGALVDTGTVQSRTHGDARGYPERIPAGQANAGLTAGDVVPEGWDESAGRRPVAGSFPLLVWEGELMDGRDAVVIRPALWEVDGDNTAFEYWKRWVAGTDPRSLVANAPPQTITQVTGDTVISHVSQALTTRWGKGAESWADPGRDRPIGMTQYRWRDLALVLTREAVETELGRTSGTRGTPGLLALRLVDTSRPDPVGASMRGDYTLYLRVERVG